MAVLMLFILFSLCVTLGQSTEGLSSSEQVAIEKGQKKISEYVRAVLEHYKQEDPVGVPGVPIPDPMDIPPLAQSFSIGKMNMNNIKLHGLSKFRVHHITANLAAMEAEVALTMDKLDVYGNYTLSTWLSKSAGPFTVKLKNVFGKAIARLDVERSGKLEAQEINMDITFENIDMNFEKLGLFASVFQSVINSIGTFVFDSIKPFILNQMNTNIRADVNKQVQRIPQQFPNSISPFDQLIAEKRKEVRNAGYDPYKVNDYNHTVGLMMIEMTHTWITGLSSFHRVGNMMFEIKNNTLLASIEVGTQKLEGTSHWEVSVIGGVLGRAGSIKFSVEYIKVQAAVKQSMDTRNSPILEDIQLELGNIQVRFDGAGTLDYVIEFAINIIPNILRYQIMDALESPIKMRIQEELNNVDLEKMIVENAEKMDEGKLGNINDLLALEK